MDNEKCGDRIATLEDEHESRCHDSRLGTLRTRLKRTTGMIGT